MCRPCRALVDEAPIGSASVDFARMHAIRNDCDRLREQYALCLYVQCQIMYARLPLSSRLSCALRGASTYLSMCTNRNYSPSHRVAHSLDGRAFCRAIPAPTHVSATPSDFNAQVHICITNEAQLTYRIIPARRNLDYQ